MNERVLCGTDVWLDFYFGARKGHREARELVGACCARDASLLVPSSCLGDFFYLCQAGFKDALRAEYGQLTEARALAARSSAWACAEHLLELAVVVGSDHADARIAAKYRPVHGDLGDDLVIAAALRADADVLVTGDEGLRRHSPVLALSAREALAFLRGGGE